MPFVTSYQRTSQSSTTVVVITGDGELLISAPSSEMLPLRTDSEVRPILNKILLNKILKAQLFNFK